MSGDMITIIVLVVFLVLLLMEVPVAWALGLSGTAGVVMLTSFKVASSVLASVPFESTAKYSLIVIPMYILLGTFTMNAGIAERLYDLASRALRRLPGGIGIATVAAGAGFAAVSGSSVATAATIGKVSVRQMERHGYRPSFAAGIVAISATLGILIPPSVVLVIYAILSGESVARLFAAGIVPGALSAIAYMVTIVILSKAKGNITPRADLHEPLATLESRDRFAGLRSVAFIAVIFLTVMVGLYSGIMTATESAAIAAILGLLVLIIERRKDPARKRWGTIFRSMSEASGITSMSFGILIGASIFTYFLVSARVPFNIAEAIASLDVPPLAIVGLILLATIPLGMFLDAMSILVIVVPLTYPALMALGLDGVWFGILLVKMIEISLITPPVGMNAFVISSASGVKLESVFRGSVPFIVCELVLVVILMFFPDIVLFLPDLLTGR
jgi:tripartite ATP-independent transporter DctM subunit